MNESKKRSLLKAISYRAILTAVLAVITYTFTGNLVQTSGIIIIFSIVATFVYYAHERIWTAPLLNTRLGAVIVSDSTSFSFRFGFHFL
jgi:uncharacterized membrane protein